MIEAVKEVAQSTDKSNGSRRMKHALNALGYQVGRQKARSLMREASVKARYRKKFKVTTNSRCSTTYWHATLVLLSLIKHTSVTSLTPGPERAGCIWRCSSICSVDG